MSFGELNETSVVNMSRSYSESSLYHDTNSLSPEHNICAMPLRKTTSFSHLLIVPRHPSKEQRNRPTCSGKVITSLENIGQLEDKAEKKRLELQEKEERKRLREEKKKLSLQEKENKRKLLLEKKGKKITTDRRPQKKGSYTTADQECLTELGTVMCDISQ